VSEEVRDVMLCAASWISANTPSFSSRTASTR
jgi:hypothetical protein